MASRLGILIEKLGVVMDGVGCGHGWGWVWSWVELGVVMGGVGCGHGWSWVWSWVELGAHKFSMVHTAPAPKLIGRGGGELWDDTYYGLDKHAYRNGVAQRDNPGPIR